ncbi:hypothetical protein BsWGS_16986 [Bradybaena similaris]
MAEKTVNWPWRSKKKAAIGRSLKGVTISGPILREDIRIPSSPDKKPPPLKIPEVDSGNDSILSNVTAGSDDWERSWGVNDDDDDVSGSPELDPMSPVSRQSEFRTVFKSDKVVPLTSRDFRMYLRGMEKAWVMFYNPNQSECLTPGLELGAAAETCYNEDHGFAAVDCSVYSELCCKEQTSKLPVFKLYSNGFGVSTLNELKDVKAGQLKLLMTMTPVLHQPRQTPPHP